MRLSMQDAPKDKQILLLIPAFDTYAKSWWIGYYSYVEKGWVLKTPYTINHKSVVCSNIPEPIKWRGLPPHNKPLNSNRAKSDRMRKARSNSN